MGVSIRKRRDRRGTHYQVVADLGPDPATGKRHWRTKDCNGKKEAQEMAAAWLLEIKRGTAVNRSDKTVGEMMEYWLDTHASALSPKTQEHYRYTTRRYLTPHLGSIKIQQLRPDHIVGWQATLRKGIVGGGQRTIQIAHRLLKQALAQSVTLHLIPTNPATDVAPTAKDKREKRMCTWTEEQANTFLAVADDRSTYGPIWRVSLATGMRRGELLGLRWQDVNWDQRKLFVRQTVGLINGRVHVGPPKTPKSIRDVIVDQDLMEALREHMHAQNERRLALGEHWHDHDLVFAAANGNPINPNNLQRAYDQLLALADVPRINIHGHRHTHATWAIKDGLDEKTVSERLGHASVEITLDLYTHPDEESHRAAGEKLGGKISRKRKAPETEHDAL